MRKFSLLICLRADHRSGAQVSRLPLPIGDARSHLALRVHNATKEDQQANHRR